jgi:hypothetical protein
MAAKIIPTGNEVVKEAIIMLGASIMVALVLYNVPELKAFIKGSKDDKGCNCGK